MAWRLITDSPVDFHIGEGEDEGWCRCNAGAPPTQAASGECLSGGRTCMASWTDATFPGCAATQNACSTDAFGNVHGLVDRRDLPRMRRHSERVLGGCFRKCLRPYDVGAVDDPVVLPRRRMRGRGQRLVLLQAMTRRGRAGCV